MINFDHIKHPFSYQKGEKLEIFSPREKTIVLVATVFASIIGTPVLGVVVFYCISAHIKETALHNHFKKEVALDWEMDSRKSRVLKNWDFDVSKKPVILEKKGQKDFLTDNMTYAIIRNSQKSGLPPIRKKGREMEGNSEKIGLQLIWKDEKGIEQHMSYPLMRSPIDNLHSGIEILNQLIEEGYKMTIIK